MNHVKLIESSLEHVKCVDKENDAAEFIKRFGHIQQNITPLPSSDSQKNNYYNRFNAKLTQTPQGVLIKGASTPENNNNENPISFNFSESDVIKLETNLWKCYKIWIFSDFSCI